MHVLMLQGLKLAGRHKAKAVADLLVSSSSSTPRTSAVVLAECQSMLDGGESQL
jgi:hypothetical protein